MPFGVNLDLVASVMERRRMTKRIKAGGGGRGQVSSAIRKAIKETEDLQELMRDPLEQAKAYLRKRGYVPVCKVEDVFLVGRHKFEKAEQLFEFAAARGWASA